MVAFTFLTNTFKEYKASKIKIIFEMKKSLFQIVELVFYSHYAFLLHLDIP